MGKGKRDNFLLFETINNQPNVMEGGVRMKDPSLGAIQMKL